MILRDHLAGALAGQGSLVLIGGEAGIGKTALAEAICREATEQGALVLIGRCFDRAETPAYGPWLYLFERYRPDTSLPPHPVAFSQRGVVGAVPSQAALFRQVLDFLTVATDSCPGGIRPVVLLLDDLQWSDPASLDLARSIAQSVATLPLLLLATYRSDELTNRHPLAALLPLLVREAKAARIDLRPLGVVDVQAMIAERYALPDTALSRLVGYVHARTEGNPFFLGELLRTLEEERVLRNEDGWHLGDVTRVGVPPLLRQVIAGRVARLDEESQRLLAVAAVIGHEVPLAVWATVGGVDESVLLTVVERAIDARLLVEMPDGQRVQFAHALAREALFEGTPAIRRRPIHRRVAEALVASHAPDVDAVAYQFQQARDDRAAEWLVKAGDRAQRAHARLSAADRYAAAAPLLGHDPPSGRQRGWLLYRIAMIRRIVDPVSCLPILDEATKLAAEADDRALAAHVLYAQGLLRCNALQLRDGMPQLEAGVTALRSLPPIPVSAQADLDFLQTQAGEGTLIHWLAALGRFAEAREQGERFIARTATDTLQGGEIYAYTSALRGLMVAYAYLGEPDAAQRVSACAVAILRAGDGGFGGSTGSTLARELTLVVLPYRADRIAERQAFVAEMEEALRQAQGFFTTIPARYGIAASLLLEGHWDEVRQLSRVAETVANAAAINAVEFGSPALLALAQGETDRAWWFVRYWLPGGPEAEPGKSTYIHGVTMQRVGAALALEAGDLDAAKAWLDAHTTWLAWSGARLGRSERDALWAQYYRQAGNADRAYEHARQAITHATEPRQPLALLAVHRLLGELETAAGRYEDAERHLAASLALADNCRAPYERALTLLSVAELRCATGEVAVATTLIEEARAICTPLDAKPALARAAALAARLVAAKAIKPTHPAGLSEREVEVLRLVARGRTNRDIADSLFLSEHTVRHHLTHILAKTDAANRAEAVAFALRHDLA